MRAMVLNKYGSGDFLQAELPTPSPKTGQVRVKVYASAFGPADYKVALGIVKFLHGRKFPLVLGYDFSGVIDSIGPNESRWKVGDSVFGFLPYGPSNNQGAFSEFVVVQSNQISLKPSRVSHEQAAAVATSGLTALQAIRDQGGVSSSKSRVLITGVSGAVGATAILVAQQLGAHITVLGSKQGLDLARRHGVNEFIDRNQGDVVAMAKEPFDVIFDAAAAFRWSQWKRKLKNGGTFITTLPSGTFAIDKLKSLISPSSVKMVSVKAKTEDLELLGKWLSEGLEAAIDSTLPVRDVAQGLKKYRTGNFLGRIAIDVANNF